MAEMLCDEPFAGIGRSPAVILDFSFLVVVLP